PPWPPLSSPTRRSSDLEARMPYILVALGVFACAASALLLTVRSQPAMHPWPDVVARMWSVGTLFLSLCAFLVLPELLMNLPTIIDRKSTRLNSSHVKIS